MRTLLNLLLVFLLLVPASCSGPASKGADSIADAERLLPSDPDSALTILESLDPSDLTADSLKARLHYLKAYGHMKLNRSMVGDSLISLAYN